MRTGPTVDGSGRPSAGPEEFAQDRFGDTNIDGLVDIADFNRLTESLSRGGESLAGDLDYNEAVNLADFAILKENFGVEGVAVADPGADVAIAAAFDSVLASQRDDEDSLRRCTPLFPIAKPLLSGKHLLPDESGWVLGST